MTPKTVEVKVPGAPYEAIVGHNLLRELGAHVRTRVRAKTIALVTDSNVAEIHGISVQAELVRAGFEVEGFTVAAGEVSKSWAAAGELLQAFAAVGLERTDCVVALGGGVVSDLAGFAAAVYQRGVDFVNVPTSLLGQVDAAIGGKTGVDLPAGKNLAGAFKQPRLVVCDTKMLEGLPDEEWRSGFAEIVKSAAVEGSEFFAWLESNAGKLAERDRDAATEAVERCVRFKAGVVAGDEREESARECLNYGHTLGHALEKVLGYGTLTHGQAIAEGMRFASDVTDRMLDHDSTFSARQGTLLDALGLERMHLSADQGDLLAAMHSDKKARGGEVRFVLVRRPGEWSVTPVGDVVLRDLMGEYFDGAEAGSKLESAGDQTAVSGNGITEGEAQ